jgi:hypothetical protein
MNKKEIRDIKSQWIMVILAAMIALFAGVAGNALYDLLKEIYSRLYIFSLFGIIALFLADVFTYMFMNLEELRKTPDEPLRLFLVQYLKKRLVSFHCW